MKALLFPVLLLLFTTMSLAQNNALPAFEQFGVTEVFKGKPVAPQIRTPSQRMFRTMIREGAAKGPNFAGHYTIAEWGCGSSCVSIAIIDAKDGSVYDGPFGFLGFGMPLKYEERYSPTTD